MKLFQLVAVLAAIGAIAMVGFSASGEPEQSSGETGSAAAAKATPLPKDVYADSLSRLPLVKRENLDEQGKKAYDDAAGDTRSLVGLQGPGGIRLHSPRLAETARPSNQYLRFDTKLGRRLSELAILVTARELDQQFEWTAHEGAGLKAGLEPAIIDVVRNRKAVTGLGEKETTIIQLGRELFQKRKVSSDLFARALKLFGEETLVDIVSLMGNYASTSVLLNAFDQHLLPGQKPLLPMP